jgi:hypothetical protein
MKLVRAGTVCTARSKRWGFINYVIAPQKWDHSGKNVKTDPRDATQMGVRLDQYVGGQKEVFSVVMVPTEEQEQRRSMCRHRTDWSESGNAARCAG